MAKTNTVGGTNIWFIYSILDTETNDEVLANKL